MYRKQYKQGAEQETPLIHHEHRDDRGNRRGTCSPAPSWARLIVRALRAAPPAGGGSRTARCLSRGPTGRATPPGPIDRRCRLGCPGRTWRPPAPPRSGVRRSASARAHAAVNDWLPCLYPSCLYLVYPVTVATLLSTSA